MTPELFHQVEAHGGIVDLSSRATFRLTGNDRVRYLNGQVTNDVRTANAERTLYACVTDLKGKIVADIHVHAGTDCLLLDAEPDLREILGPRLERYIIADDAELTDITDECQLWHGFGEACEQGAGSTEHGAIAVKSNRLGITGLDLWLPSSSSKPQASSPILSAADFETYRILRGIPRYPNELNAGTFPPEAGLDASAMSYTKGCYIGQEILSRIRTTGKMPRTLIRWTADGEVKQGDEVLLGDKVVGTITSVATHPITLLTTGLAYVRQGTSGDLRTSSGTALVTSGAS
jgi:folate-binding protein YgfZ